MTYTPSKEILDKYARVLIQFALWDGQGIKPKDVVHVVVPECAKPIFVPLRDAILEAGGYPIMQYLPDDVDYKGMYNKMTDEQLTFFPRKYYTGLVDEVTHFVRILADYDKYELKDVDPKRIMQRSKSQREYIKMRNAKENRGESTWTLGLYGTEAMASDVDLSLEDYWAEIIKACYLDEADPIAKWREVFAQIEGTRAKLNAMPIRILHMVGEGTDLIVKIDENRSWLGGSGRNIPSFEIFISPIASGTEGIITFDQPLYTYGNKISGISLTFEKGEVVAFKADEGQELLAEMLEVENAKKIGEFSLTDGRLSRITKRMGETLYDENVGGPYGNSHIAIGNAYRDSYPGDMNSVTEEMWKEMSYNESAIHTDIIQTTNRKVTATLEDGTEVVIYDNGEFRI